MSAEVIFILQSFERLNEVLEELVSSLITREK